MLGTKSQVGLCRASGLNVPPAGLMERDELGLHLLLPLRSPGLGLPWLSFDADSEFDGKPQSSPFPVIPLFLSSDWGWEKNRLQMLLSCIVCNFQW